MHAQVPWLAFAAAVAVCTLWPATLFLLNVRRYKPPPPAAHHLPAVSVLIPARNEEQNIAAAVQSVLSSRGGDLEVIVLDDHSSDRTAAIVTDLVTYSHGRLRLAHSAPLPQGWNGKQHACWQLAQLARYEVLCFLDADVTLTPDALARMATFLDASRADLVSGFPRQITVTWLEKLLIPLIHYMLLGFLPMRAMRRYRSPSCAAGCGQFLMVRREAYFTTGGHSAIRATMHDGLLLPKLLRQHHRSTDLADLTPLAACRMYSSADEVWHGLAKNATEGIGAPARILPISLILLLGQVLPTALVLAISAEMFAIAPILWHHAFLFDRARSLALFAALSTLLVLNYLPRLLAAYRFRQSFGSALLHPIGILALLALQWYALARKLLGRPIGWKSRTYAPGS